MRCWLRAEGAGARWRALRFSFRTDDPEYAGIHSWDSRGGSGSVVAKSLVAAATPIEVMSPAALLSCTDATGSIIMMAALLDVEADASTRGE